jgi:hypothetical protein
MVLVILPLQSSISTVSCTLRREGISNKVIERIDIRRNDKEGLDYFKFIGHIHPNEFADIDEISSAPSTFYRRNGWSKVGEKCIKDQIVINSKSSHPLDF